MRDWAIVVYMTSSSAAKQLGESLRNEGVDVDIEAGQARVWAFAEDQAAAEQLSAHVVSLELDALQAPPELRAWDEARTRYVDPAQPDVDPDTRDVWIASDLDPADVRWRVRIRLDSVFEFRRIRRELPSLGRPVLGEGSRHVDLGARDKADADAIAARATRISGVAGVEQTEIRSQLQRWLIRQRLAGNYGIGPQGPGYDVLGFGDGGGGGHGVGGDGGGHHGGH